MIGALGKHCDEQVFMPVARGITGQRCARVTLPYEQCVYILKEVERRPIMLHHAPTGL